MGSVDHSQLGLAIKQLGNLHSHTDMAMAEDEVEGVSSLDSCVFACIEEEGDCLRVVSYHRGIQGGPVTSQRRAYIRG